MRRFARLKAFLPAVASILLSLPWAGNAPLLAKGQPAPPRRIGVWLTNSPSPLYYDPARIDRAVQELA